MSYSIGEALKWATQGFVLEENARLEAHALLAHVLGCDRSYFIAHSEVVLEDEQFDAFKTHVRRRAEGEPLAYIMGYKEFWSLPIRVDRFTLIPRPETEVLVEVVLEQLPCTSLDLVELGVGSGAISLALAKMRPLWHLVALDRCPHALACARENAAHLGATVHWLQSDWCQALPPKRYHAMISNPPYVSQEEWERSPALQQEPYQALVAGTTGLEAFQRILQEAPFYLRQGGLLALEHGSSQAESVKTLMAHAGFGGIYTVRDLAEWERVTVGFWNAKAYSA